MSNKVYIVSRLDHPEIIKVGPGEHDSIRISPRAKVGPFESSEIPKPLPRGIVLIPVGAN